MKKEKLLTEGNLWKGILYFSFPLIASNILQVLFNLSDIAVVGNFSSIKEKALGSVGSTSILVTLFTGFLIGIGSGVNVVIANLVGKKDQKGERTAIFTSFFFIARLFAVASKSFSHTRITLPRDRKSVV